MKTFRETLDQLDEISRRGFLKGAGAAAAAGVGLAPEKAQSNVLIPILQGIAQSMLGTQINNQIYADIACAPRDIKVGQKVMFRGETQEVKKIYGEHPYCKNPDLPIAVKVGKPEPTVQQPPNQVASTRTYAQKIIARIKPNMVFDPSELEGNPIAEVELRSAPNGRIMARKLIKPSGNDAWDAAVIRAIDKTDFLPLDLDGTIPTRMVISWGPQEIQPQSSPNNPDLDQKRREQLQRMAPNIKEESLEETSPEALAKALAKIDKLSR